jgi:hypothetical protein
VIIVVAPLRTETLIATPRREWFVAVIAVPIRHVSPFV